MSNLLLPPPHQDLVELKKDLVAKSERLAYLTLAGYCLAAITIVIVVFK